MPYTHDLMLVLIFIVSGLAAGYIGGLLGVGGGTILVPIFLTIFSFTSQSHDTIMHSAIATSLGLVIPTGIAASYKQLKEKRLHLPLLWSWVPFIFIGVLVGVAIMSIVSTLVLKYIFTSYLFLLALYQYLKMRREAGQKEDLDDEKFVPGKVAKVTGGVVIGGLSTLLGLGGGTFTVPFFSFFRYPLKNAVALSSATGIVIGFFGVIGAIVAGIGVPGRGEFSFGYLNLLAFFVMTPMVMISAPWGVNTENRMHPKKLKKLYLIFITFMAFYMLLHIVDAYYHFV